MSKKNNTFKTMLYNYVITKDNKINDISKY